MIIPYQSLSQEALNGLIEEFVTRDGTDYGDHETGLEQRVLQVKAKLKSGDAVVVFSESHGEANIMLKDHFGG